MTGRRSQSPFADRVLIGSITVLVLALGVFVAYNANNGLPFVPTYNLNVQLPDAAGLIASDSVLIGGTRVGYVGSITATALPGGHVGAVAHVRLDKSIEPLPVDSTDLVRPVSPLGVKYLEIDLGHSHQALAPNATIPASHTHLPVEIDNVFNMFDPATRKAARINFNSFGDAFAGRGADLNQALSEVEPLVDHLLPVTSNLLNPQTRWAQLFPSLEQASHEVVGVADREAQLFGGLDQTFTPLSQATPSLRAAIAGGPPALRAGTQQLPAQAQFLDDSTNLFHRLRPAFASLATASQQLAPAIAAGIPALHRAPQLNGRLVTTLQDVDNFAGDPRTLPGLELLTQTASLIEPTVAYLEPAQTTCNYLALFFRNLESTASESDIVGSQLNVVALPLPQLPNSEAGPASAPADGPPAPKNAPLSVQSLEDDSYLHSNSYPSTAAPGQPAVCEAGNEVYIRGRQVIGNAPQIQQRGTEQTTRVLP
jgi:phospholipid/cholesterol/gamma-HCH transport system substrate-binding protein